MPQQKTIGLLRRRPASRRSQVGFTLVEIMIVILILGVLLNIAMPSLVAARDASQARSCISNLKRLSGAKEEYALDKQLPYNSTYTFNWTSDLSNYVRGPRPTCPTHSSATGYTYNLQSIGQPVLCPYGAPASNPTLIHQYNF